MTIEDTIRQAVREEVRAVLREELRAALTESKPAPVEQTAAFMTVEEVAKRAGGVKPATVRNWIREGKLVAQRAGHRFVVSPGALDAFLNGCSVEPKQATLPSDEHLSLLMGRIEGRAVKRNKR